MKKQLPGYMPHALKSWPCSTTQVQTRGGSAEIRRASTEEGRARQYFSQLPRFFPDRGLSDIGRRRGSRVSSRDFTPLGRLSYQETHARREAVRDTCKTKFVTFPGSKAAGHGTHHITTANSASSELEKENKNLYLPNDSNRRQPTIRSDNNQQTPTQVNRFRIICV